MGEFAVNKYIDKLYELLDVETEENYELITKLDDLYGKLKLDEEISVEAFKLYPSEMKVLEYASNNCVLLINLKREYDSKYQNKDEYSFGLYLKKPLEFNEKEIELLNVIYNKAIHIIMKDKQLKLHIGNCPNAKNQAIISLSKEKVKTYSLQN